MLGKIAIEEHFALPETLGYAARHAGSGYWSELGDKLLDLHGTRLEAMHRAGIELSVISLNAPAIQDVTVVGHAVELARKANDFLAEQLRRHPSRFAGFAALPMQDPEAAARELYRCVRELGFRGALVNGYSNAEEGALYYDLPRYFPFWAEVESLNVPFYLHPRDGMPDRHCAYAGHPWLVGSPWSFGEETALHALRLIGSGLFDRCPRLQIILGHLGERIPFDVWRLDHRLSNIPNRPAKRSVAYYLRTNFYLTTSGHFSTPSLIQAILTVGPDRIVFAVDYPFEKNEVAAGWFDQAGLSEHDQAKIGRLNTTGLLNLN